MSPDEIIVVSGLPRSGTSMMMRMLEAGGVGVVVDEHRTPDADNPRGYYELERAKRVANDSAWLADAGGKAFKIVSLLLLQLPMRYRYRVIFLQRHMGEILRSQRRMLERLGRSAGQPTDEAMAALFDAHLRQVREWLTRQANIRTLTVRYADVLQNPRAGAEAVSRFLDRDLDLDAMARIVDPALYRERIGAAPA